MIARKNIKSPWRQPDIDRERYCQFASGKHAPNRLPTVCLNAEMVVVVVIVVQCLRLPWSVGVISSDCKALRAQEWGISAIANDLHYYYYY